MDSQTSQEFIEPPPTNPGPQTFRPQTPQIIPEVEIPPARTPRPTFFPSEGQFPPMGTEGSTVINNLIHQLNMSAKKAVQQDQAQGGIEPPPSTKIKKRTIAEVKAEAARKAREKRATNALLVKQKKEEEQEKRRRRWEERQKENEEESQTEEDKQQEEKEQNERTEKEKLRLLKEREDNRRTTQAEREIILQRAQKFAQDQQEINMQLEAEFTALQQEHARKIAIQEQELQAEQRKLLDNINKAQSDLQIKIKKRQQEILLAKAHADKEIQHNENIRVETRNKNEAMDYYHSLDTVDQQKIADLMAKYKFTFLTISAYNLVQIFKQVQSEGSDPDTNVKKEVVSHKQKTDPPPKLNLDDDQSDDQSQVLPKNIKISKIFTPKQTPKSNPPKGSRDSIVGGSMLRAARNKNKIAVSDDTDEKLSQETCDRLQHMLSMIDSSDEFSEFYDQLSSYLNVSRDGKRNIPDKDISFFKFSGETLNQFLDYLEKYHKYAIANFQPQEYRFITVLARFVEKGVLKNCIDTLEFDNITYMDMLLSIFTILDENIVKVKSRKDAFETLAKIEGEEAMHLVTRIRNSYQYAFPGSIIEHDKRAIAKVMEFLNPDLRKELKRELALCNSYAGTPNTFSQTIRVLETLTKHENRDQLVYTSTMTAAANPLVSPLKKLNISKGTKSPSPGSRLRSKSPVDTGFVWDEEGLKNGTGFTCPTCQRVNIGFKMCISCTQRCFGCYKTGHFQKTCYRIHPKVNKSINKISTPSNQLTTSCTTNSDKITSCIPNKINTPIIPIENKRKRVIYNTFKTLSPKHNRLITRNPISNIKLLPTKSCFNQNNIPSNKKVAFDTKLSIVCGFDSRDNAAALSKKASEKILPLKYKFNKINSKAISEKGDRTKTRPVYVKTIPTNTPSGLTVKQSEIYLNTLFNNLNKEIRDEYIDLTESEISEINELNSITERNSKYNQADTFINSYNVVSGSENETSVLSNEEEVSTNQPTVPIEEIRYAGPMIQDTKISENSTSVMLDAFQHLYDYVNKITFNFEPNGAVFNHFYCTFNKIKDIKCMCFLNPSFNNKNVILPEFLNINKIYKNLNYVFSSNYPNIHCKDEFFQIFYLLFEACKQFQTVKEEENTSFRNRSVSEKFVPQEENCPVREEVLRPCIMMTSGDGSKCDHSGTTCAIANDLYTQKNPDDPKKLEYLRLLNGLYCAKNWLIDGLTEEIDSKWRPNIFRIYININGHCITALVDSG
ncbi:unnamed protein product, partial [Rotaria magnacalcarata]